MAQEAAIDALNDLIQINNDRIEGYQKAIDELKDGEDGDLKTLFSSMIDQSEQFKVELKDQVASYGGDPSTSTTARGKIYRAWMDVRAAFTGGDRYNVLASCERGEDAAKNAYKNALQDDDITAQARDLISRQAQSQLQSHDRIKAMRDAEKKD